MIELLVVLSIIGLVIGAMGQLFITQLRNFNDQQDRLTIHEEALKASDALTMLLMPCDKIASIDSTSVSGKVGPIKKITVHIPKYYKADSTRTEVAETTLVLELIKGNLIKDKVIIATHIASIEMWPFKPDLIVSPNYTSEIVNDFINPSDPTKITTGIRIKLNMESGKDKADYTQDIFFRNKP